MKITFDLNTRTIEISGDGDKLVKVLEAVREIAPTFEKITFLTDSTENRGSGNGNNHGASSGSDNSVGTLKRFCRSLSLSSNSEKIAAIAHYKKQHEQVDQFSPKEMGEWFTQCGFSKPSHMSVACFDAKKRNGYVEPVGGGKWRLTTNGLNLVVSKLNNVSPE